MIKAESLAHLLKLDVHYRLGEEIHQVFFRGHIFHANGAQVLLLPGVLVLHIYVLGTLVGGFILSQLDD